MNERTRKREKLPEATTRQRRAVVSSYESDNFESRSGIALVSNTVQNTFPTYEYPRAPPLRTANVHTEVNLAYGDHDHLATYANVHHNKPSKKPRVPPKTMFNNNRN